MENIEVGENVLEFLNSEKLTRNFSKAIFSQHTDTRHTQKKTVCVFYWTYVIPGSTYLYLLLFALRMNVHRIFKQFVQCAHVFRYTENSTNFSSVFSKFPFPSLQCTSVCCNNASLEWLCWASFNRFLMCRVVRNVCGNSMEI